MPRLLLSYKDHPFIRSGYGILVKYLAPLLAKRYGVDNVLIFAPVYQRDHVGEFEGMKVLPGTSWDFGEPILLDHYRHYGCDLLIQGGDVWPLGKIPDWAAQGELIWMHHLPVDWLGLPKNVLYRLRSAHKIIPYSKYGENALRQGGLTNVGKAIWLGLNTELWKPVPWEELGSMMNLLGYEDSTYNLLIVAANQERKNIRESLEGISLFRKIHPEVPVRLYLHSHMRMERDLLADCDQLGLGDILIYPDPYIMARGGVSEQEMVKVFSCADVLLNPSLEGFGLTMTQAQAVGVPVIYLQEGPGPELIQFGVGIPPMAAITAANQMSKPIPNPAAIAKALEVIWQRKQEAGKPPRSERAIQFVQENFSWEMIAEQWYQAIDELIEERERFCWYIPAPSKELQERAKEEMTLL